MCCFPNLAASYGMHGREALRGPGNTDMHDICRYANLMTSIPYKLREKKMKIKHIENFECSDFFSIHKNTKYTFIHIFLLFFDFPISVL